MGRVIIGVVPHKLSVTIEVLDERENVCGGGRFGEDRDGYRQMLAVGRRWPDRVWAFEGNSPPTPAPSSGPGRTHGGESEIQRGQPNPDS